MQVAGADCHPPKDAKVSLYRLPVHVDVALEGGATPPVTPSAGPPLGHLQRETRACPPMVEPVMAQVEDAMRQIRVGLQQRGEPSQNCDQTQGLFTGKLLEVIGWGLQCRGPNIVLDGLPTKQEIS